MTQETTIIQGQDETLDLFLNEVETEFASVESEMKPKDKFKVQRRLMALMSQVHSEISGEINGQRIAMANGFSANKIDYILDSENENYLSLMFRGCQ